MIACCWGGSGALLCGRYSGGGGSRGSQWIPASTSIKSNNRVEEGKCLKCFGDDYLQLGDISKELLQLILHGRSMRGFKRCSRFLVCPASAVGRLERLFICASNGRLMAQRADSLPRQGFLQPYILLFPCSKRFVISATYFL